MPRDERPGSRTRAASQTDPELILDGAAGHTHERREQLLQVLAAATFLIFFQAFMVAPLLPRLADLFRVSVETMGLIVPAYLIPYGLATLVYGPLSDRFGRGRVILASLLAFILLTGLTAAAWSPSSLLLLRLLTGLGASGVVPIALALLGDLYPYHARGRPLGWLFGAMAGGMAVGTASAVALALDLPLLAAALLVTALSLGYDLTQPLFAGIVTDLSPNKGQAMGLNVFTLFTGFGLGSLIFAAVLGLGLGAALVLFGAVELLLAVAAIPLFRAEVPREATWAATGSRPSA